MSDHQPQDAHAVRAQLQRMLMSRVFLHSERLRRFLTHCVEAALAGRIEDVKEYTIGVAVFDRPVHYSPAEDPIVRVEARRLRKKIDEYYVVHGASDPVLIQLPKGGYLPVFEFRRPAPSRSSIRTAAMAGVAVLFVIGGLATVYWAMHQRVATQPQYVLTRITSDRGLSTDPALSEDGSQLVYASDRASKTNLDIWLQPIDRLQSGGTLRRLTEDPADDSEPAISPDKSTVAFRSERQPAGIYVVTATGGAAKLIAPDGRNPRYSPDGRWIAYWVGSPGGESLPPVGKVFIMAANGGSPRQLFASFAAAACPVWSPDNRTVLAEAMHTPSDRIGLWTASIAGDRTASLGINRSSDQAPPQFASRDCSLSWSKDSVILSALESDTQNLWRLPLSPEGQAIGPLMRVTFGSAREVVPFANALGATVFASRAETLDIWRVPVAHPEQLARITELSTASFPSARGGKLAFLSKVEGRSALWLKDIASARQVRLAEPPSEPRYPQLCPDAETVMYSEGPNTYSISASSAKPRLVCNGCARTWQCTEHALLYVPAGARTPVEVREFVLPGGPSTSLISSSHDLANAQIRSDGWVAFHAITGVAQRQIFVAPYRSGEAIPGPDWVAVTDGLHLDRNAVWNDRGDVLYFLSERCGFRCLWSQRLDPQTHTPLGEAVAVRHFHSAQQGLSAIGDVGAIGLSYAGGYLYFTLAEQGGDIWLVRPPTGASH